jgi:hypothetical protein
VVREGIEIMSKDYFEDRTTFEERFCNTCQSYESHRVLSRWGVPPRNGRKKKIPNENFLFEREINSTCCRCYPFSKE